MEVLQSSYVPGGGGGALNFTCYKDLDQASSVYSTKISEVSGIPPKIIES